MGSPKSAHEPLQVFLYHSFRYSTFGGKEISWEEFAEVSLGLGAGPLFLGEAVTGSEMENEKKGDGALGGALNGSFCISAPSGNSY